jgi:hypothetical protein
VRTALHVHVSGADETRASGRKGKRSSVSFPSATCRLAASQPPDTGVLFLPSFFILQADHGNGGETGEREMSASAAPSWLFRGAATRGCRDTEAGKRADALPYCDVGILLRVRRHGGLAVMARGLKCMRSGKVERRQKRTTTTAEGVESRPEGAGRDESIERVRGWSSRVYTQSAESMCAYTL